MSVNGVPIALRVSITSGETTFKNAGEYTFTAFTNDANYLITDNTKTVTINKAALTITANDYTIEYGAAPPVYTVTFDGFVNDETHNVLGGTLSFACEYVQGGEAKTYAITRADLLRIITI